MYPSELSPDFQLIQLVQALRNSRQWDERRQELQENGLAPFLNHVLTTVPFYTNLVQQKKLSADFGLDDFPWLTKQDILENYEQMFSTSFAANILVYATTSGTTGTPLVVARDPVSWYGFAYGAYTDLFPYLPDFRSLLIRGTLGVVFLNDNPSRSEWSAVNPSIDCAIVQKVVLGKDDKNDREIIENLARDSFPLLCGRPRTLSRLVELNRLFDRDRRISPHVILCSGDNLHDDTRRNLEEWYNCKVHNSYTSTEGGFIGVECKHQLGIHVLSTRAKVEVLLEHGEISDTGTGELIVTNLENWAMPFVRYKTGDFGTVELSNCACGHSGFSITQLAGRDSTFFVVGDRQVPPTYLNSIFESLPIRQFQVIQDVDLGFHVNWIPALAAVDRESIEQIVRSEMYDRLGAIELSITMVDAIGMPNQKVQRFINRGSKLNVTDGHGSQQ